MAEFFRIFQNHEFIDRSRINAHFRARRFGIGDEASLKLRIDPRAGNHLGAVGRRARLLVLDLLLNIFLRDDALFDEQIAYRVDSLGVMAQLIFRMFVAMCVVGGAHGGFLFRQPDRANARRYRQALCLSAPEVSPKRRFGKRQPGTAFFSADRPCRRLATRGLKSLRKFARPTPSCRVYTTAYECDPDGLRILLSPGLLA